MKSELSSLDLYYLVKELKPLLAGAKINKVYEQVVDKQEFLFILHKTGPGRLMLRIKLPEVAYLTEYKQVFPETPPGFCTFLRKYLNNARITEVRQRGFERILEFVLDTKEGRRVLVCELFSKGNMVLVDEDYKIKGLLQSQNWEARTVRGGAKYEYPPAQLNTPEISENDFSKIIDDSKKDSIVKTLAIDACLSGVYAEELCLRANIDKGKKRLDDKEIKKLYSELKNIFNQEIKASSVGKEVFPFKLLLEKEAKEDMIREYETFNKALDEQITEKMVESAEDKVVKEKHTKEDKTQLIVDKQKERLEALEKQIAEDQRKGELIYENYQEIDALLKAINIDRKKMSWEELKEKYAGNKKIKSIDEKTGEIIVEI